MNQLRCSAISTLSASLAAATPRIPTALTASASSLHCAAVSSASSLLTHQTQHCSASTLSTTPQRISRPGFTLLSASSLSSSFSYTSSSLNSSSSCRSISFWSWLTTQTKSAPHNANVHARNATTTLGAPLTATAAAGASPLNSTDSAPASSSVAESASAAASSSSSSSASAIDVQSVAAQTLAANPDAATLAAQAVSAYDHGIIVTFTHTLIEYAHALTGLPWWGTIIFVTVLTRAVFLPLWLDQQRNSVKFAGARKEMEEFNAESNELKRSGALTSYEQQQRAAGMGKIFKKHGVSIWAMVKYPVATMIPLTTFFISIKSLVDRCPDIATGGAFWFPNLAIPDPTWYLPLATSASLALIFYTGSELGAMKVTRPQLIFQGVACVGMAYAAHILPASIAVYFIAANSFSLLCTLALTFVPGLKKLLNVPVLPSELLHENKSGAGKKNETVQQALITEVVNEEMEKPNWIMSKVLKEKPKPKEVTYIPYIPPKKAAAINKPANKGKEKEKEKSKGDEENEAENKQY